MITIKIADATGHQELVLDNKEAEALVNKNKGSWVFVNNKLVQPDQINYDEVQAIEIMPA